MKNFTKPFIIVLLLFISLVNKTIAQETTASLNGLVTDEKNMPVTGASVIITHEPTGYKTGTQSNSKGIFLIPNLKPGGPYIITISFTGMASQTLENVNLSLGNNPDVNIILKPAGTDLKEVVVTGKGRIYGPGVTVGRVQLTTLPTLGRSLSDFTRLTPQSNNNSFAGTSFRYNNITLDGAVNNDAIGFSNSFGGVSGGGQSGTAGAGTRTNPYSLDAIQEVQVQLAPYDVKLGNFTGGSVNAVTKSGTNFFHGDIYAYGRNQTLTGKSVDGQKTKIGKDFYDYQYGASINGPLVKNKAFFFVNYEITRRQEPTFFNAGDPGSVISVADAQKIVDNLKTKYNYDPGTYGAYKIFTKSNKLFTRIDWNINARNSLMFRAIYTDGSGNNLERSSTNFQFSSTDFTQYTKNLNLVAELKTKLSSALNNNLIVSYIKVHEYRDFPGTLSPFMDINNSIWLGTWREASIYNMKQQTIELTDNVTYNKGIHKFTFGTHNEFYNLTYGFINSWNGRWQYSSLNNFLNDKPSRIRGAFSLDNTKNTRDNLYGSPIGQYNIALMSAYAQDEIAVNKRFKLTPGIRIDYPTTTQPPLDPGLKTFPTYVSNNPTYTSTPLSELNNKWLGTPTLSPRLGFSYDVKGNQKFVIRGGSGIFVGRMPFAWLGYANTLTGSYFGNIDYSPNYTTNPSLQVPLAINPLSLKDTVSKYGGTGTIATRELNLVDNNFKLPSIWRSNIAADIKFGNGYKLTLDAMYTKTLYDVKFQQPNIKDTTVYFTSGPTQTPAYIGGKLNSAYSNIYLLTNTREGYRYNFTAQLSKYTNDIKLGNHLMNMNWMVAYTYGKSKDVSNGIRNSFQSNYEVNPAITPSNASLAYSNFDLRHRIVASFSTSMKWNASNITSVSFFYSGQSGSPYTFIYNNSGPFGNATNFTLPYIPKDQSDIRLADIKDGSGNITYSAAQQWTDLNNFVSNDPYLKSRKGQYAERNAAHTPWNHQLDMKLMHEFKLSRANKEHALQISFDVFNVLNLLNNNWGHINFVTNSNNYSVNLLNFTKDANGKNPGNPTTGYLPTFTFNKPTSTNGQYYTVDPINSRWQGQLGIKYSF